MRAFLRVAAFFLGVSGALPAVALTGCNVCALPNELQEAGRQLENSFRETPLDELRLQRWSGGLCEKHICFAGITEEMAKELLIEFLAASDRSEDQFLGRAGIALGLISTLLSVIALWQTHQSTKTAREASDRSIRNEARLDQINEG